ncbi:MAG: MOSC domain-containing protein [Anaerolineae bacterium]|nr:MOSC domain-containing protein [Anaerolineae bacterium]
MNILSINLGKAQSIKIGKKIIKTGIFKEPTTEKVIINKEGILNDLIVDTARHGGADQAIYLYSALDYRWWENELGHDIPFGTFGENLTLDQFPQQPLRIGDRFKINNVVLEITFGRIPCATLGACMNDATFVKKFAASARYGVYARVLQTGTIKQGDTVKFMPTSQDYPTVKALFDLFQAKRPDQQLLREGLNAPIASRARSAFQYWLEQGSEDINHPEPFSN